MAKRKIIAALAALGLLCACAPTEAKPPAAAPQQTEAARAALVAEGRALAETHCASCHAIGETGESRNPAAPPFRTLAERYPGGMLQQAFAQGVLVGHRIMPDFHFEQPQIDAIVVYLESIQERRGG